MKTERLATALERLSIRTRLGVTYTLLIVIPLSLLGWLMLETLDRFYLTHLQAYMTDEAGLLAASVVDKLRDHQPVEALFLQNKPPLPLQTRPRVLLFDAAGRLLLTSDPALAPRSGTIVAEAGVAAALAGHAVQGVEASGSSDHVIAYVALPVLSEGQVLGAVHLDYALDDIQTAQNQLRALIIAAGLGTALLASLVGLSLTARITRPLARLSTAAADIAGGNFAGRVAGPMPAELEVLAQRFNQMAAALEQAQRARQVTFASIAHDVRTPLGSLRAAAEALAAGAVEQPVLRARLISGLIEQSQYLGRLTDDLLRLAAYEAAGPVLRRGPVRLSALLHQAVEGLLAKAAERGILLEAECRPALPCAWADADRILEVLFNLIDNALTYTPPGGAIRLWAELEAAGSARVWIHVSDTGPGLAPAALANIFESHWRGDYRLGAGGAHLGLGLNISREIVSAHGGQMCVSNRAEGGADFCFSLPVTRPLVSAPL